MTPRDALHSALQKRLAVVGDHAHRDRDPASHLAALKEAAAALETIIDSLPESTHPEIRHYLERQSYQKAVAWLEDPANPF